MCAIDAGSEILVEHTIKERNPFGSDDLLTPDTLTYQVKDTNSSIVATGSLTLSSTGRYYTIIQTETTWIDGDYSVWVTATKDGATDIQVTEYGFVLKNGGYTSTVVDVGAVVSHSGNATLTTNDLNKTHLLTAAGTLTMPTLTSSYEGSTLALYKKTTGNVEFKAPSGVVIGDSVSGGVIANTTAAQEDVAAVTLTYLGSSEWGVTSTAGTWTTT